MSYLDTPGPLERGDAGALFLSVAAANALTLIGMFALFARNASDVSPVNIMIGIIVWIVMTLFGLIAATAIGLPLTLFLEQRKLENAWIYPLAGAFAGAIMSWLIMSRQIELPLALGTLAFGGVAGGLTGLIWWILHRRNFQNLGD